MSKTSITYWLSYGGGVNSTALAILLQFGRFPQYEPWRVLFADTRDEEPETYEYIDNVFRPWLRKRGRVLETACADEGVIEKFERLRVTGSRIIRTCTIEAKIKPVRRHILAHGTGDDVQLIGIDAGESHRMASPANPGELARVRPLVDANIDRDECVRIIEAAGLPVPPKSGCWHCPFKRAAQVIQLAIHRPCDFARIERLEAAATEAHGRDKYGNPRTQWGDKPASYWRERANGGPLFDDSEANPPCGCYDG